MYKYIKRFFDILFSILILIIFGIPMLIIAIIIKIEDGGPVIFKQLRMGKNEKTFYMYKFRSMILERKELDGKLSHEEMTTKIGKFIRKTSFDELPQIFNILKGEMSFIGPRPWIIEYYNWMNPIQKRRVSVLPGITGLAQVRGRNGISVDKKIEYDLEYVNHFGLKYDLKILKESFFAVFSQINAEITENGINKEINHLKETNTKKKRIKISK